MMALLRAYGKVGGTCLQVNVLDAETLRQAQQHPDEYRNLLVRVTGYNAYFTGLGKRSRTRSLAEPNILCSLDLPLQDSRGTQRLATLISVCHSDISSHRD
jgi:hypothetical protein